MLNNPRLFFTDTLSKTTLSLILAFVVAACSPAEPTVKISDAWVRATKPGQEVAAGYLTLESNQTFVLGSIESPEAGTVQIHEMRMDDGVMKMRRLDNLTIEKGHAVSLAPGETHLMLFDLKKALMVGEQVTFTLHFKDSAGHPMTKTITSSILAEAPEQHSH